MTRGFDVVSIVFLENGADSITRQLRLADPLACRPVIEQLLPSPVRAVEAFADRTDIELFPDERAGIEQAVERRRREYVTVRACARDALGELGFARTPIISGVGGMPCWPYGVIGSMTHCEGYRAAAVARQTDLKSVGIDAEPDAPLPEGVLSITSVTDDLEGMERLASTGVAADRLLFSAKESVFKAWFPLTRRWLGFDDVTVALRDDGTFSARLLVSGTLGGRPLTGFSGRWMAADGLVLTAIAFPGV